VTARVIRHGTASLVADADGSYASIGSTGNVRVHAVLGGLRVAQERDARFLMFAQFLAGAECYCGTTTMLGSLFKGFTVQPGAGADWPLTPTFAVRVQTDVRHTMGDGGATRVRLVTGGVVRFGPRTDGSKRPTE
jgi:hypothetical protein